MWLILLAVSGALTLASVVYLVTRFHRFSPLKKLGERHPVAAWLLALLPVLTLGLFAMINLPTLIVVLLHLAAGFLLCALAALLLSRLTGRAISFNLQGAAALVLTALYLGAGWFFAHHVFETHYRLETEKPLERELRIVALADSHLGITLDGEAFARQMDRISALKPDAVVIVGDFVDDESSAEDLSRACRALGELDTACGVYFVFGNHDTGYYGFRHFSVDQLREELTKNGVVLLEDESVPLLDSIYLVGRCDRTEPDRTAIKELLAPLDESKYLVVLDHQPNDYAAEAAAGADLVVSGHTHGGHLFPAGQLGLLLGANDAVYGLSRRGGTAFIVTSGISGWAIPFKTGARSEFVVIDIIGPQGHKERDR